MERIFNQLEGKLCTLLYYLTHLPCKLEMIADEIDNENLRNALCAVAVESDQYAKELYAHLRWPVLIAAVTDIYNPEEDLIEKSQSNSYKGKGKEVLLICERNEALFSGFYTDLLNNHCPDESLKKMMNYQLAGIRSAFARIRFLNSLRFLN